MTVLDERPSSPPQRDATDEPAAPRPGFRWPTWTARAVDAAVVVGCCLFVFWQLHPDLILSPSTPTGGDMGAHVWAFGYLRDTLLPAGQLAGWAPDWYAGFPAFQFYMVIPFLGMVLLNAGLTGAAMGVPTWIGVVAAGWALGARTTWIGAAAGASAVFFGGRAGGILSPDEAAFGALVVVLAIAGTALVRPRSLAATTTTVAGDDAPSAVAGEPAWLSRLRHPDARASRAAAVLAIVVALAGIPFSFGASFKLIAVLGVVTMPACAYLFGRLARLPEPAPAVLAVTTVAFLFDTNFSIYGGNIASTMAGEFAFSIAVAVALVYLGVLVRGLQTGRHRAAAAVLLALVGLCHLLPAFFALAATVVILVVHLVLEPAVTRARAAIGALAACSITAAFAALAVVAGMATTPVVLVISAVTIALVALVASLHHPFGPSLPYPGGEDVDAAAADPIDGVTVVDVAPSSTPFLGRTGWLTTAGVGAALLSAFWVLPFFLRRIYLNDMGWEKIAVHRDGVAFGTWFKTDIASRLLPDGSAGIVTHTPTDLRLWAVLALAGAVLGVVYRRPVTVALTATAIVMAAGFVYAPQGRLWNARILPFWYLLIYALAAIGIAEIFRAVGELVSGNPDRPRRAVTALAAPLVAIGLFGFLAAELHNLPVLGDQNPNGVYEVGVGPLNIDVQGRNIATDWSAWNFSGVEAKDKYPEYRAIVDTMAEVGESNGCGRALWEYHPDLNNYGTPMALMLLPHWTDGCIGSMEGLYFEASSTTPFHFLVQSELSQSPSRAQRDMPYRDLDVAEGVRHLQMLGVRYYMAYTPEATDAARRHPDLTEIADSVHWTVFEVADAPLVEGLTLEPAVTTASESQHEWLCEYLDEAGRCRGAALDQFQDAGQDGQLLAATGPDNWQRVDPGDAIERRRLDSVAVTDVVTDTDAIEFRVDRVGVPVVVKASYFPNWSVDGAEGPYRVSPNLMVVVPTDAEVSLHYGRTGVDWMAMALTALGLVLVLTVLRRPVTVPPLGPGTATATATETVTTRARHESSGDSTESFEPGGEPGGFGDPDDPVVPDERADG